MWILWKKRKKISRIFYNFDKFPTAVVGINQTDRATTAKVQNPNVMATTKSRSTYHQKQHNSSSIQQPSKAVVHQWKRKKKKDPNIATNKSLNILNGMAFSRNINKSFAYENYNIWNSVKLESTLGVYKKKFAPNTIHYNNAALL